MRKKYFTAQKRRAAPIFSHTQEVQIFAAKMGDDRVVVKVPKRLPPKGSGALTAFSKQYAVEGFASHSLFYALFPEHAIKPKAITFVEDDEKRLYGVATEIVQNRDKEYKKFVRAAYTEGKEGRMTLGEIKENSKTKKYFTFVENIAWKTQQFIWHETGIWADKHPINIAFVEGNPVFFEIDSIDTKKLETYIERKIDNPQKAERLKRWIQQLPKDENGAWNKTALHDSKN
ncbi:MAG: hypothetical protein V1847_03715 [Candidatus Diapherotrites archaeon]